MSTVNYKAKRFIEEQFPISRLSRESYDERKAGTGQTLTGIGKWWGRKPLILVRATLLGILMPTSDDKVKDASIFLKALMMDDEATWFRLKVKLSAGWVYRNSNDIAKEDWFDFTGKYPKWKANIDEEEQIRITKLTFLALPYEQRIELCYRPEEMTGFNEDALIDINSHLGTTATTFVELIQQLGEKQFGYKPRVGDAFCGGGSIPFETCRLGLDSYASDLNPVAGLLTFTAINLVGGSSEKVKRFYEIQDKVFKNVDNQVIELGIEHNEKGWRAEYYLYCNEAICPVCNWKIPLLPDFLVARNVKTICKLLPIENEKRYRITIHENVTEAELNEAKKGTVSNGKIICPHCNEKTPINVLRGDIKTSDGTHYGLRQWENKDLVPFKSDVFDERLYCIRWLETITAMNKEEKGKLKKIVHFSEPDINDLKREKQVIDILTANFDLWQEKGFIPTKQIESGYNTEQPIRERGWRFWHQLFCPRQLLQIGLFSKEINQIVDNELRIYLINLLSRLTDWNSRLSIWLDDTIYGRGKNTFYNQALNTLYEFSCRGFNTLDSLPIDIKSNSFPKGINTKVNLSDCRDISETCDIWITDPPYSDAVNYHELGDFFLAWYEKHLPRLFPDWYTTSQKEKAVKGNDDSFISSMIECYRNLAEHMPENGLQIVMFTHSQPEVWADLAIILWAAGLQVTASWNIATETPAGGVKDGNYVQSTALLVCRKRISDEKHFMDELTRPIKNEVEKQLKAMREVDVLAEKNFTDVDYFNAASAASLKVITGCQIPELNAFEVLKKRSEGKSNPLENLIQIGRRVAAYFLRPQTIDEKDWDEFNEFEKFYLKGLDIECQGDNRIGTYQDLAKGLGVANYNKMFAMIKANNVRMKTPEEFGSENLNDGELGATLVRKILFAVYKSNDKQSVREGQRYFQSEFGFDYQANNALREKIIHLLQYFTSLQYQLVHWKQYSETSTLLIAAMKNESLR